MGRSPDIPNLVELLERRANDDGDRVMYTFLLDGETSDDTLSPERLALKSRALAVHLRQAGLEPGDRALLLFAPGLGYIAAF